MRTKKVRVVPYDPGWKSEFQKLRIYLENALGESALAVEHVGSTSVEGLPAKPILDIDVVIGDCGDFPDVKNRLEGIGYFHEGDLGIADREAFKYQDSHGFMAHHLYVCPQDSRELKRHVAFRDYLRTHPEDREKYAKTKLRAADAFPEDIDGYMAEKGPCIEEIYRRIGLM